jgi:hypothetical protein
MSPRKRRTLALPFLVTVATSCTVQPGTTGESKATANSQPAPNQDGQTQVIANPPPPGENAASGRSDIGKPKMSTGDTTTAKDSPQPTPTMIVNPPPPAKTLPAAPTEGGRLEVRKDATCWWIAAVDCPKDKNITCNPPPPRQVACPEK